MNKNIFLSVIFGAVGVFSTSAGATNWSEQVDLCAAAVDAEGLANVSDYRVKFSSATGSRRLEIKLIPNAGGDTLIAECRIRRSEVTSVALKA